MPITQHGSIRAFEFDLLAGLGLVQGIFTRRGGASPAPWYSLNVGGTVGDDPTVVSANRQRTFEAMGRPPESIYDVWQVHGTSVVCADAPRPLKVPHLKADALLTDRHTVTLFMRFADCVPVLLADPVKGVVGIVHAGWKGSVQRAAAAAVGTMQARYGSRPADVRAGIGPSIGVDHYPVGQEVVAQVRAAFGADADGLLQARDGKVHFDLWAANRLALEQAGVGQIELAGVCTACHSEDWFSHRGEHGRTGRFGAMIAIA